MFGKADGKPADNAIMGYNYDVPVLGGFAESAYPAFKLNGNDDEKQIIHLCQIQIIRLLYF